MKPRIKVSDFYKQAEPQLILSSPSLTRVFFTNPQTAFIVISSPSAITKYSFQRQESLLTIPLPPQINNKVKGLIQISQIVCFFVEGKEGLYFIKNDKLSEVKTHLGPITALTQHKSQVVTGSDDMTIRIWNVQKEGVFPDPKKHALCGHTLKINTFLSFGQLLLSGSADKLIIVWEGIEQKSRKIFQNQVSEIISCEQSQQIAVREAKGSISIFCGNTMRRQQKWVFLRSINNINVDPILELQEMDDSFLEIVSNDEIQVAEINHGVVMGTVKPKIGNIVGVKCTRTVTLLAVAQKGIFLLNF